MLIMSRRPHPLPAAGFSLVELMIAITLGILVISGVFSIFITTVRSNSDMLKTTKLEEELAAAMTYMVRDIRRAGYTPAAYNPANLGIGFVNTFDAITIADTDEDSPADDFDCLLYSYDADGDGALTTAAPDERRGFRFNTDDDAIAEREGGTDCAGGGWENITASNIAITNLRFEMVTATKVIDVGADGTSGTADDSTLAVQRLAITIDGQLANDPEVARTLQQTVRIRNDSITP